MNFYVRANRKIIGSFSNVEMHTLLNEKQNKNDTSAMSEAML